jgi:hypothetical protein
VNTVPSHESRVTSHRGVDRPRLELSGPKLALALETLVAGSEDQGGIERYVEALRLKAELFQSAFAAGRAPDLAAARPLFAHLATVRRRAGPYLSPESFAALQARIARLLAAREDTSTTDARIAEFCAGFPGDRAHRWVRDLAAELLHNVDPERYPLMNRWVWDADANTGVIRELWHGEGAGLARIEVPDGYGTFVVLREELAQYLARNGVFRDTLHYVDLLTAQVYAGYISEQGDSYLRTDFSTPADPLAHARRLLGLDGTDARGRSRLKAADGIAQPADAGRLC